MAEEKILTRHPLGKSGKSISKETYTATVMPARALTGESDSMHGEAVADFKPGDQAAIKVDPQRPAESLFLCAM